MSRAVKTKLFIFATLITTALIIAACADRTPEKPVPQVQAIGASFKLNAPLGLDLASVSFFVPEDNPLTEPKLKLGKRLFFDKSLSADGTVSCASCHLPEKGFADPNPVSIGVKTRKGTRQAPTIINRAFSRTQFWDGRAATLEEQALAPLTNPVEMGNPNINAVIRRLQANKSYLEAFHLAFPDRPAITEQSVAQAIASFERTILAGNSPFDHFVNGDKTAISESATRGYQLFLSKANCAACHSSFNFTDEIFHNLGIGSQTNKPDPGRFAISKLEGHQGAFKTPTLRELTNTSPYMSDGSIKTLEEVIEYYDKGCQPNRWLSPKIKALNLSAQEKQDLVELLKALTGEITWYGKNDDSQRASTSHRTQPRL